MLKVHVFMLPGSGMFGYFCAAKDKISPRIEKLKWFYTLFHTCSLALPRYGKVFVPLSIDNEMMNY